MISTTSQVVQMLGDAFDQKIGTALARKQIAADRAVAEFVANIAASTSPPAPAGQGKAIDVKV